MGELADAFEYLAFSPAESTVQPGRFRFYSAHDATLAAIIGALEATELKWPQFRSNLLFELWQHDDERGSNNDVEETAAGVMRTRKSATPTTPSVSEFFIRIIYNGRVPTFFDEWCDMNKCPLSVFLRHLRALVPKDPVHACSK